MFIYESRKVLFIWNSMLIYHISFIIYCLLLGVQASWHAVQRNMESAYVTYAREMPYMRLWFLLQAVKEAADHV